jgi:hypothetical protein
MASTAEAPYNQGGNPPLINHGGPVMSTPDVGSQVVLTPIYWAPSGYTFTESYKSVINTYIANLAADSGKTTNVFGSLPQYSGSNGTIGAKFVVGTPLDDAAPFPSSGGCTPDSGSIYADNSGYTACVDDAQLTAETGNVLAANGLTSDLGHMYLVFLPQGVESCFGPDGSTNQACTINYTASSAYCAYHSAFGPGGSSIYAAMPFPVYYSGTNQSCSSEGTQLGQQSPNGDVGADVELSPLSHEVAEAITDPHGDTWYDSAGYENGDDCSYIYGTAQGTPGAMWNQTINGAHYLTQEEFSNADFVPGQAGCVQQLTLLPTITSVSPGYGSQSGGQAVTITGTGFSTASTVRFGSSPATGTTVVSPTQITARTPAAAAGSVDITVTTSAGTSPQAAGDVYTYTADTALTLAPSSPSVVYGSTASFTADLSSVQPNPPETLAGQRLDLLATTPSGTTTVATAQTDTSGNATFTLTPPAGATYQANFAGTTMLTSASSPIVGVAVTRTATATITAPATASYGQTAIVTGSLRWSDNSPVSGVGLDLWFAPRGGTWAKTATATTSSTGIAAFKVTPTQTGTYQVRYPGGQIGGLAVPASTSGTTTTTVYRAVTATVAASANRLGYGHSVPVTGTLAWTGTSTRIGGQPVELWAYAAGRWSRVGTGVTATSGSLTWTLRPAYISTYQLRYAGNQTISGAVTKAATSNSFVVRVVAAISAKVPASAHYYTTVRITGTVAPGNAGSVVNLYVDGRYRIRTTTDRYGHFTLWWKFPRGTHTVQTTVNGNSFDDGAWSTTYRVWSY